jgi:hypothetical protein
VCGSKGRVGQRPPEKQRRCAFLATSVCQIAHVHVPPMFVLPSPCSPPGDALLVKVYVL